MTDLYGCGFPVHGPGASPFDISVAAVRREVAASMGVELSGDEGFAFLPVGMELRWRRLSAPDGQECIWTVAWSEPDAHDIDSPIATAVTVVRQRGTTLVRVRRGPVVRSSRLGRLRLALEPPALVPELLDSLVAKEDGLRLRAAPWHVDDGPPLRQLTGLLLDPERVLPVVVISVGAAPGEPPATRPRPLVDPVAIARTLAGVAHVFVLDSARASFAVTEVLGRSLSVFGGAVRLYWPGAASMAEPGRNTILLPQAMSDRATTTVRLALVRRLMPVALVRGSAADVEARIRAATHQVQERSRRRRRAENGPRGPSPCEDQLRAACAELGRRHDENIDLADQVGVMEEDLRTFAARWIAASPIDSA